MDDETMEELIGVYYTMDEIREVVGAKNYGEEFLVVQPLVGQ